MSAQPIDGWIDLDAYCDKYGERKNTVVKRVTVGVWARGEFYSAPSGGVAYINEAKARDWLEQRGKLVL